MMRSNWRSQGQVKVTFTKNRTFLFLEILTRNLEWWMNLRSGFNWWDKTEGQVKVTVTKNRTFVFIDKSDDWLCGQDLIKEVKLKVRGFRSRSLLLKIKLFIIGDTDTKFGMTIDYEVMNWLMRWNWRSWVEVKVAVSKNRTFLFLEPNGS